MNRNLRSISSWGLSSSCDLWIHELEFRKSGNSGTMIFESGIWKLGTLIWPFWGLESAHDCLNFKVKESESRFTWISLRNVGSTDVVVYRVWRSNHSGFKSIEYCWSYVASSSLNRRYERLDKTSDRPCWKPGQYVIKKLKHDNDRLQRAWLQWAWHQFNTRVDMKYSRFLWSV
jgi:hypothetical protein